MPAGVRRRQYLETCDPFHAGGTGLDQLGLGLAVTFGMAMPMIDGAVVLVRRRLYPEPSDWRVCGMARPTATTIRNYVGFAHAADSAFQYSVVRCFGNGYASVMAPPVRVDFDGGGALITPPLPMWPSGVTAEPIDGGQFTVSWHYDSFGQGAAPTDFAVYAGPDGDNIDYVTPLGTVTYDFRLPVHSFTTGAFADGTPKAFAVRARNSTPVEEKNTYATDVVAAQAAAPVAATISLASPRRVGGARR